MGDCWLAIAPCCPAHGGQMSYRDGKWTCHGWDGEGCGYQPGPLDWVPVSEISFSGVITGRLSSGPREEL